MKPEIEKILLENEARERRFDVPYDPARGIGCCGERVEVDTPVLGLPRAWVPRSMVDDPQYGRCRDEASWQRLRCRHDFEYWAATCAKVRHKLNGCDVPFVLNHPQRRVAAILEGERQAGRPIRLIMLKARQWGGSTLVQMYMAWMQLCVCRNWHSLICAHVKDTAANIRGMYTKLLDSYPELLWDGDEAPAFRGFERSINVREIAGRGCRVTLGSSENQEAVRGSDYAMAHLSETAFWQDSTRRSPEAFIRAICGAIALQPNTLIAIESTANGVGNYFHREWLRSVEGSSDKIPVFVAWHDIEIYRLRPDDPEGFVASFTDYERMLWDMGLSLSQIWWYRRKTTEYQTQAALQAEFPSTPHEAFTSTGAGVFSMEAVERLRTAGCTVEGIRGDFNTRSKTFTADPRGCATVWERPSPGNKYVAVTDVGGRSDKADWSVIAVFKVGSKPEIVAQWRGHIDHDLLVDKAMAIGRFYNNALLVVESNTLETEYGIGDGNYFVLNRLSRNYPNLYRRKTCDSVERSDASRPGFHTNRSTKAMVISTLIEAVREDGYIERDHMACDELICYEQLPNGSYAAKIGCHDDILMTRAIGLHIIAARNFNFSVTNLPAAMDW